MDLDAGGYEERQRPTGPRNRTLAERLEALKPRGRYARPVDFRCPVCSSLLEDAGESFIVHIRESPECREEYEHGSDSTAREWAKR